MRPHSVGLVLALAAACKPDAGPSLALITSPRVLALAGEPAEAAPGASVTLSALVATPDGSATASLDWSLCLQPKPLTTNNAVSPACLTDGVDFIARAAPAATAIIPVDACALFGPELSRPLPGRPQAAPTQPDVTGGYYQPYRADLAGTLNVGLERIGCNLAGAAADVAIAFRSRYLPNRNPTIASLTVNGAAAQGARVGPGARLSLSVAWPSDAVEEYPILEVAAQALITHREAIRVSWFATAGSFDNERTGRAGADPALQSDNVWTTPAAPATAHVWVVVRDDRGGAAWTDAVIEVAR
jgi:hypothetical protein